MKTLTMERLRRLEGVWVIEIKQFLLLPEKYGAPHPLFLCERDIGKVDLTAMSQKWGVSEDELREFVGLRRAISAAAYEVEGNYDPRILASELKIPLAEAEDFVDYFLAQVRQIREDEEEEEARDELILVADEPPDDSAERSHFYRLHQSIADD